MARRRHANVITGSVSIEASLLDAIGGGVCEIHGKYFGEGKHGLRSCPLCDIDEYFAKEQHELYCEKEGTIPFAPNPKGE